MSYGGNGYADYSQSGAGGPPAGNGAAAGNGQGGNQVNLRFKVFCITLDKRIGVDMAMGSNRRVMMRMHSMARIRAAGTGSRIKAAMISTAASRAATGPRAAAAAVAMGPVVAAPAVTAVAMINSLVSTDELGTDK